MTSSAIITIHRQGRILVPTLRSLLAAREHARANGFDVEFVIVGDRLDAPTRAIVQQFGAQIDIFREADVGDPGIARQIGVALATKDHVFFHDADDLYCESWYTKFLTLVTSGNVSRRAIYHGQVMVGFGEETYFRMQTASMELGFDTAALTCQWYFATNLMAPREVCLQIPVPPHVVKTGLGHDDWAWSCDTLAAGVPRGIVPGTVSFYREKPPNQGVGKVPGIIHHASKLFAPAFVREQTARMLARHHATGPFAFGGSLDPRDRASETFVPGWVIDEVRAQARFEPMLTELYNPERTPRMYKTLPRRANVALAYRDLCEDLDDRPKVIVSVTEKHLVAADMIVAETVASVVATVGADVQVICLVDGEKFHWDRRLYLRKHGALVLDITGFRREYQLEDWYFYRFIMRLYVQFEIRAILDFGSDFFHRLFTEFNRPICALVRDIRFVNAGLGDDPVGGARLNIVRDADLFAATTGRPAHVLAFSPGFGQFIAGPGRTVQVLPAAARAALRDAAMRRFATDPSARATALAQVGLGAFLLGEPNASRAPMEDAEDDGADKAAEVAVRPRERICVIASGGGVFAPDVLERARLAFAADPTLEVLIPQVVFWLEPGGGHRFTWLEPHRVQDRIAGCVDLMILNQLNLPFFALFRASGSSFRHYKRLQWRDYADGSLDLLRELYDLAEIATVRPLESVVCAPSRAVAFDVNSVVEHV